MAGRTPNSFYNQGNLYREQRNRSRQRLGYRRDSSCSTALPFQPRETLFERPEREIESNQHDDSLSDNGDTPFHCDSDELGCVAAPATGLRELSNSATHGSRMSHIVAMMQRQQEMLRDVLAQQTSIKTQQSELCQKVLKLEEEVLELKSINSSISNASPPAKKKIRLTRDLTVSNFMLQQLSMLVSVIHNTYVPFAE